jgi:hypothetical protein
MAIPKLELRSLGLIVPREIQPHGCWTIRAYTLSIGQGDGRDFTQLCRRAEGQLLRTCQPVV